jgi:hypothetical protein
MSYSIVSQNKFTLEQKTHIESMKDSFKLFYSEWPDIIICVKDTESRYIAASNYTAKLVGLSCGEDMSGRLDYDLPCKAAEFAQDFVDEDSELLSSAALCPANDNKQSSMLSIHQYSTGLEAFISFKSPIIHTPSQSILGVTATAYKINISYLSSWTPDYLREFGMVGNFEKVKRGLKIDDFPLTEDEHIIAFLMIMRWDAEHIARFLTEHQELSIPIASGAISKCLDELCQRFGCDNVLQLRDRFIHMGFHRKMPDCLFSQLLGNRPL